jgi:hypothetical protein
MGYIAFKMKEGEGGFTANGDGFGAGAAISGGRTQGDFANFSAPLFGGDFY